MNEATFTQEAQERLKQYLNRPGYIIPDSLGSREAACSMAAINLAISSELTDDIPDCMSAVIGNWIIPVQDSMPMEMRNSPRWKAALVRAAGTGHNHERECADMLIDWMWTTVLPPLQPVADDNGFGKQWHRMYEVRSIKATNAVTSAVLTQPTRTQALAGAANASYFVGEAIRFKLIGPIVATNIARSAASVANAGSFDVWKRFDPVGLLERLVAVSEPSQ